MIDYLNKRPMLLSALMACIICIAGNVCTLAIIISGVMVIILIALMLVKNCNGTMIFSFLLLFLLILSCLYSIRKIENAGNLNGKTVSGEFIVIETPKVSKDFSSAVIEADKSEYISKGLRIYAFFSSERITCGDRITAKIRLKSLNNSKYQLTNYSEGIYLQGNMQDIILTGQKDIIISGMNKIRNYISETLFSNLGYCEASTLSALVYGDKTFITEEFDNYINSAGVSHVMVVSGMHLAIIVSLFVALSQKFFYNRFLKALVVFMTVVFMTALCGFSKSILRAGLTYILYTISIILKRQNNPENTLGAAVLLILIANPFALFSIGFRLSVLSTFGILVIAFPVIEKIKIYKVCKSRAVYWLFSSAIISLSALLMTMPVTIYIFGYISVVSVLSNILVSEAVTFALILAIVGLIINLILPVLSKPFFLCSGIVTKYINGVIEWLGRYEHSVAYLGKDAAILAAVLILLVLVLLIACKKRNDMIKLNDIRAKIIREGGGKLKWQ